MQRRVKEWRSIMAKELVYGSDRSFLPESFGIPAPVLVGVDPRR